MFANYAPDKAHKGTVFRHLVVHGDAGVGSYTKARALQVT